jgi:hypothetical protein
VKNSKNTDDQRHLNGNKNSVNPSAAAVEEKFRLIIEALATANGMSVSTFHAVFHEDLGLGKKSAGWMPKVCSDKQKWQSLKVCNKFVSANYILPLVMLDYIITMNKTMVCYRIPQTKKHSQ